MRFYEASTWPRVFTDLRDAMRVGVGHLPGRIYSLRVCACCYSDSFTSKPAVWLVRFHDGSGISTFRQRGTTGCKKCFLIQAISIVSTILRDCSASIATGAMSDSGEHEPRELKSCFPGGLPFRTGAWRCNLN